MEVHEGVVDDDVRGWATIEFRYDVCRRVDAIDVVAGVPDEAIARGHAGHRRRRVCELLFVPSTAMANRRMVTIERRAS